MSDKPSEEKSVNQERDAQGASEAAVNGTEKESLRGVNIKKDIFNLPNMLTMMRVIFIPIVV